MPMKPIQFHKGRRIIFANRVSPALSIDSYSCLSNQGHNYAIISQIMGKL